MIVDWHAHVYPPEMAQERLRNSDLCSSSLAGNPLRRPRRKTAATVLGITGQPKRAYGSCFSAIIRARSKAAIFKDRADGTL
jgi:hypothetical protein